MASEASLRQSALTRLLQLGEALPSQEATLLRDALELAPRARDLRLLGLVKTFALSEAEAQAIALLVAVELEPSVGVAVAALQAPTGGTRPTIGLLEALFGAGLGGQLVWGAAGRAGLIERGAAGGPLAEQAPRVPDPVLAALEGVCPLGLEPVDAALPLPASVRERAARVRAQGIIAVRSGSRAEAEGVARVIAEAAGRALLRVPLPPPPGLGPVLHLLAAAPLFRCQPGPGELVQLPPIPGYGGPVLVTLGVSGAVQGPQGSVAPWTVPQPTRAEREALWAEALGPWAAPLGARLQSAGRIAHLAGLAKQLAGHAGEEPGPAHVANAAWMTESGALETLAEPVRARVDDSGLVLTPALREQLEALRQRCLRREELALGLGPAILDRYQPGVKALLSGPSGTGKTLAASWLATQLGRPLFRVDLGGVLDKYIGETEKRLGILLEAAEDADVVLLFDEADALFARRTEVQHSHDRYANAQTSYLLQRLEGYTGVVLLTSNASGRMDQAFTRRLDTILHFTQPGPEELRALWVAHLGDQHGLSALELNRLAATVDLPGGHVRGAVLGATALAAGGPVRWAHVVAAVRQEYRKLGRAAPGALRAEGEGP